MSAQTALRRTWRIVHRWSGIALLAPIPAPGAGELLSAASRGGPIGQFLVFLTGVFPVLFAITGLMMGCRGRKARTQVARQPLGGRETLAPAG